MTLATTHLRRGLLVLLLGTALGACLWLLGLGDLAWLGFIAAAVWWPPLDADRDDGTNHAAVTSGAASTSRSVENLAAGTYRLLPELSTIDLRATKLRYLRVTATLNQLRGVAEIRDVDGRHELSVDAAAPVVTFRSGNPRRDVHVLQPAFLDARAHPWMTYSLDRCTWPTGRLGGTLTVRGTPHDVVWRLDAVDAGACDGDLTVRATTSLSRRAFGVAGYRWLVGDQVKVTVYATVRPQ